MEPEIFYPYPLEQPAAKTIDVSVCILARRQLEQLPFIYEQLTQLFQAKNLDYEIIVMADSEFAENDEHLALFSEKCDRQNNKLKIFRMRKKSEKGALLKSAEKMLNGHFIVTLETGGRFQVSDVENLLNRIQEGFDFVNGIRNWHGEPRFNKWQSSLFNWVTRKVTRSDVHDLNSTIKIFRNEVIHAIPLYGDFYRFLPVLAEQRGFRVTETPVARAEEQKGNTIYGPSSYVRRFLDILNLLFLTQFTEKPLRFFGGFGMTFFILGVVINFTLVIQRFFYGEGMADRVMLLFAILLIVIGIQSISIGLIGEMIVFSRTKDFKAYEVEEVI